MLLSVDKPLQESACILLFPQPDIIPNARKPFQASDYRARYYDPTTGRFVQEDPIRFGGGVNFYLYVGNSPTTFTDPFGLEPEGCKDCQGQPKQGLQIAKSCCSNEPPMPNTAPNPYSPLDGYEGISAQQMFLHGGNGNWGNLVRSCLVCMYSHGADPSSAHHFCYWNSAKRAPLSTPFGFPYAVGAAGTIGVEQVWTIINSIANGQIPPVWALGPIIDSYVQ
jgi:hypothetical protein